ncbi:MAG: hypothetical protein HPY71_03325 [Firmicutes bacterium]|nr:hypothetical protein [Bacillota bacterium]
MNTVEVRFGSVCHKIYLADDLIEQAGRILQRYNFERHALIVTDSRVGGIYSGILEGSLSGARYRVDVAELPGRTAENVAEAARIVIDKAGACAFKPGGAIIALGGSTITRVVRSCITTHFKEAFFVKVPTTLFDQVDSSAMRSDIAPRVVLIDFTTLETLPGRELSNGMAEVIKYGIIRDKYFCEFLQENAGAIKRQDQEMLKRIVTRACEIEAAVFQEIPDSQDAERILSVGCAIAEAVQGSDESGQYKYGDALAIAMARLVEIGARIGITPPEVKAKVHRILKAFDLPVLPDSIDTSRIMSALSEILPVHESETAGGPAVGLMVPRAMGKVEFVPDIPLPVIEASLAG